MRILLIVAALVAGSAFAQGQEVNPPALDIEQLSGWFRYESPDWGCSDAEDNKERAALGRYSVSNGEFTFGIGKLGLSFYDGGCEFFDPVTRNGKIEMVAICGAEGENFNGRATLERTGPDSLSLHSPVMDTTLIACPADEAEEDQIRTADLYDVNGPQWPHEATQPSATAVAAEQTTAAAATTLGSEERKQLQWLFGDTPPFPSVPPGTHGTEFRGVALGQSRPEVEAALKTNGLRCMVPEEMAPFSPAIEVAQGYDACHIVPMAAGSSVISAHAALIQYEIQLGMPLYAVSFIDGRAAALSLPTDYFNATASTPLAFAQSIVDHYPLPEGLQPTTSGWRGMTSNRELVTIYQIPATYNKLLLMTVVAATVSNTPSFD